MKLEAELGFCADAMTFGQLLDAVAHKQVTSWDHTAAVLSAMMSAWSTRRVSFYDLHPYREQPANADYSTDPGEVFDDLMREQSRANPDATRTVRDGTGPGNQPGEAIP